MDRSVFGDRGAVAHASGRQRARAGGAALAARAARHRPLLRLYALRHALLHLVCTPAEIRAVESSIGAASGRSVQECARSDFVGIFATRRACNLRAVVARGRASRFRV
eukprot:6211835-Pleurochrysis_carterae.AAC.3